MHLSKIPLSVWLDAIAEHEPFGALVRSALVNAQGPQWDEGWLSDLTFLKSSRGHARAVGAFSGVVALFWCP